MYLADNEIVSLLPVLEVATESEATYPFNPVEQVRSASLDLRLGEVFWIPRKRWAIDLRRRRLLEIQPRRYYTKRILKRGESIIVRPGALLLGRTTEKFTMPNGYAGEMTGRSSFARMGLQVTLNGGFINPGWRGHMPLQLLNLGPNPIRVVPGLPLCQVRIVRLSSDAAKPYDHEQLRSLYVDDDGGPSYWWRDKRIQDLHDKLAECSVEERTQVELYRAVGRCEPEVIERLEKTVSRMRASEIESSEAILERFSRQEERRRNRRRWLINSARAMFGLGVAMALFTVRYKHQWWHWSVYAGSTILCLISAYAFRTDVGDHYGRAEQLRRVQDGRP